MTLGLWLGWLGHSLRDRLFRVANVHTPFRLPQSFKYPRGDGGVLLWMNWEHLWGAVV